MRRKELTLQAFKAITSGSRAPEFYLAVQNSQQLFWPQDMSVLPQLVLLVLPLPPLLPAPRILPPLLLLVVLRPMSARPLLLPICHTAFKTNNNLSNLNLGLFLQNIDGRARKVERVLRALLVGLVQACDKLTPFLVVDEVLKSNRQCGTSFAYQ